MDLPINSMVIFHSYGAVYQRVTALPYFCWQVMASMHRLLRFALEQDPGRAETPREERQSEKTLVIVEHTHW